MRGFAFEEVMRGTLVRVGEHTDRRFSFRLEAAAPRADAFGTTVAEATGTVSVEGMATDVPATGTMEISPFRERRIRYEISFDDDDGRRWRFEGTKHIDWRRPRSTWTTLPGALYDDDGNVAASALLFFWLRDDLGKLLASVRIPRTRPRPAPLSPHA